MIANDYPLLIEDLLGLMPDRSVPVVLIKANVCRKLEPLLSKDGFTVLNGGCPIYFPSNGRQMDFKKQFAAIVARIQLPDHRPKTCPLSLIKFLLSGIKISGIGKKNKK